MTVYKVEMRVGQDQRVVKADSVLREDGWFVFYRKPPEGGRREYWRVWQADVVSVETKP